MNLRPGTTSYWIESVPPTSFPPMGEDQRTDVVVIGGGMAGLTAAYLVAKEGKNVVVLDRYSVALAETGHTTAHLTYVMDTRLRDLVRMHGEARTRASWEASRDAIEFIEATARRENIECDFEWVDGYLHGPRPEDPELLGGEMDRARGLGFVVEEVDPATLPFTARAAVRFPRNAKFHPRKYLLGLVQRMSGLGVKIYEGTEVRRVETGGSPGERATVETAQGPVVRADDVVVTTNVPIVDLVRMHTKLYPYRTYVIGAQVPRDSIPNALYWDTLDPYHYTRVERGEYVILGGEDHKVGQGRDPEEAWLRLEAYLRAAVGPDVEVHLRWSGQVIENLDSLPYIGRDPGSPEYVHMATAFSGNGMTFGTVAGRMLADHVLGRTTPWDEAFDPARKTTVSLGAIKEYVVENKDFLVELGLRPIAGGDVRSVDEIPRGHGAVVVKDGRKVAVHRSEDGSLQAVSAICTHLGCVVGWNSAEGTWDCPCHGSRFGPDGRVVNAPAKQPLGGVEIARLEPPAED